MPESTTEIDIRGFGSLAGCAIVAVTDTEPPSFVNFAAL
jgi:hypothetical protein